MAGGECRTCRDLLVSYVDGEADATERQVVEDHLGRCEECRQQAEQLHRLTTLVHGALFQGAGADVRWREALERAKGGVRAAHRPRRWGPDLARYVLRHPVAAMAATIVVSVMATEVLGLLGLEEESLRVLSYLLSLGLS